MFERSLTFSRGRIIRIFGFAIIFFVFLNVVAHFALPSFKSVKRASEFLLEDNLCNFAIKDFSEIKNAVLKDEKKKIVLLGDSVFYGIGVETEANSISGYLRELMPDYSVYNLASCGAKPLDYYLWISHFKDEDAIFVIQYNYKWFSADNGDWQDRISQKKILAEFYEHVDDDVPFFDRAAYFLTKNIPVAANRTKIFVALFGEKSKEDFVKHVFFGKPKTQSMDYKQEYWRDKNEMMSFNCKISYSDLLWSADENFNFDIYEKTLELIHSNDIEAVVVMPPYNSELTKKCSGDGFKENILLFQRKAMEKKIKAALLMDMVNEKYFLDDMHLNAEGNRDLANLIFKEIKK